VDEKQRKQFEAVLRFAAFSDALILDEGEINEVNIRQWDHRESLVFIEGRGPKAQLLEGEGFWPEDKGWNDGGPFWCLVVDSSTAPAKVRVNGKIITIPRGWGLVCRCCGKLRDDASVEDDVGSRLEVSR